MKFIMKFYALPLLAALFLAGCGTQNNIPAPTNDVVVLPGFTEPGENEPSRVPSEAPVVTVSEQPSEAPTTEPSEEPVAPKDSEIPIGIYLADSATKQRVLTSEYEINFDTIAKDFPNNSFYLSHDATVPGITYDDAFKETIGSFLSQYPEMDGFHIGAHLRLVLKTGEELSTLLVKPADTEVLKEYLESYIYDAYHANGFYVHLSPEDMKEDTLFTQIKLHPGPKTTELSDIYLSVFLYDSEEDYSYESNTFTADNSWTIHIINSN